MRLCGRAGDPDGDTPALPLDQCLAGDDEGGRADCSGGTYEFLGVADEDETNDLIDWAVDGRPCGLI